MNFFFLPPHAGYAAENMAHDFLLLQHFPFPESIRFRSYGWHAPAFTFGYSQQFAFVQNAIPPGPIEVCRRPTGGGIVDHRQDWTYALVIPPSHPLYALPAPDSYRFLHEAIRDQFLHNGQPATLQTESIHQKQEGENLPNSVGLCFSRAEPFDVIDPQTREKLAGAAQKRSRKGLLFQGSLSRNLLSNFDWNLFAMEFRQRLSSRLEVDLSPIPWPDFNPDEETALIDQFTSDAWLKKR